MKIKMIDNDIKSNYMENLFKYRGITDIQKFLKPTRDLVQNPSNLKNIEQATKQFTQTIKNDKTSLIIVDSDMDGFCSAAILYLYMKKINPQKKIEYFFHEGKQHGLATNWEKWINKDYDVIWCPDSGSNDAEFAKEIPSTIICLDHHILEIEPSENMIVVNNQASPEYSNKDACGAQVTFQFCQYLDSYLGYDYSEEFWDLAAVACVGDMMSMANLENRYFVDYGLSHIKNFGLRAFIDKQSYSMKGEINPISIAFYIVPLVNACIRVGSQEEKEHLFLAFIDGERTIPSKKRGANGALECVAIESARECTNARAKQNRELDKAVEQLEFKIQKNELLDNQLLFVLLEDEKYPPEVNGLLAMRLAAKYCKPTLLGRVNDEGIAKGSIRGINESGMNFKSFLDSTGLFEYVQGHENAAGYAIPEKKIELLHKYANEHLKDFDFTEGSYDVDFERIGADEDINDIIMDVYRYHNIYGQQMPEPLIHITDINITTKDIQIMGANADTVKIKKNGIEYLKFKAKDFIRELSKYDDIKLEVVGRASINEWGGRITPQIMISDYEIKDNSLGF